MLAWPVKNRPEVEGYVDAPSRKETVRTGELVRVSCTTGSADICLRAVLNFWNRTVLDEYKLLFQGIEGSDTHFVMKRVFRSRGFPLADVQDFNISTEPTDWLLLLMCLHTEQAVASIVDIAQMSFLKCIDFKTDETRIWVPWIRFVIPGQDSLSLQYFEATKRGKLTDADGGTFQLLSSELAVMAGFTKLMSMDEMNMTNVVSECVDGDAERFYFAISVLLWESRTTGLAVYAVVEAYKDMGGLQKVDDEEQEKMRTGKLTIALQFALQGHRWQTCIVDWGIKALTDERAEIKKIKILSFDPVRQDAVTSALSRIGKETNEGTSETRSKQSRWYISTPSAKQVALLGGTALAVAAVAGAGVGIAGAYSAYSAATAASTASASFGPLSSFVEGGLLTAAPYVSNVANLGGTVGNWGSRAWHKLF